MLPRGRATSTPTHTPTTAHAKTTKRPLQSRSSPKWAALRVGILRNGASKDQADNGRQLHDDVQRWTRSVLQWIAYSITSDGILVSFGSFRELLTQATRRNVLLGIVPGSASVAHGNGQLDAGHQGAREQAGTAILPEPQASDERTQDHQGTWRQHLSERSLRRDPDAPLVVGSHLLRTHDLRELLQALFHHVVRRCAHGLH